MEHPPFAPPFLKAGKLLISQTANILQFLAPRLGLVPKSAASRLWAHQLQLTIADWLYEASQIGFKLLPGDALEPVDLSKALW